MKLIDQETVNSHPVYKMGLQLGKDSSTLISTLIDTKTIRDVPKGVLDTIKEVYHKYFIVD